MSPHLGPSTQTRQEANTGYLRELCAVGSSSAQESVYVAAISQYEATVAFDCEGDIRKAEIDILPESVVSIIRLYVSGCVRSTENFRGLFEVSHGQNGSLIFLHHDDFSRRIMLIAPTRC